LACFESIDKLAAGGFGAGLLVDGMATVKDVACANSGHQDERAGENMGKDIVSLLVRIGCIMKDKATTRIFELVVPRMVAVPSLSLGWIVPVYVGGGQQLNPWFRLRNPDQ
jgi:hypothetical protein